MPSDEDVIRAVYRAWNEAGPRAASELWAEDVVMHDFPGMLDGGTIEGRDAVVGTWEERLRDMAVEIDLVSVRQVGGGRLFAVLDVSITGADSGVAWSEPHFHVVEVAGGAVTRLRVFRDRAEGLAAAGLPAE
jgi:ketosteroid isomerase-like protein